MAVAFGGVCQAGGGSVEPKTGTPARVAASVRENQIEVSDNQIWYGYYKGNEPIAGMGVGFPDMEQMVNNAMFIDGKDPMYHGKTIKGLRFRIQGAGDIDDISGWLSQELNVPADENLLVSVKVPTESVVDTVWTEVALPEGIAIPEEGLYAGYSLHTNSKLRTSQFPGFVTSDRIAPDGALYNFETAFMSGWQSYGDRMGKLCYQVLLEGDFYDNGVAVADFGKHYVVLGSEINVSVAATNMGRLGVSDIDYVIVTDGERGEERHLELKERFDLFGGSFTLEIPMPADAETRLASKEIVITKVNGVANESEESVAKGSLVTLLSEVERVCVAETYTGTWCGWCPRALVGNARLKEVFGDRFVSVEAHVGMSEYLDPMEIPAYSQIKDDRVGYPTSYFNRELHGDPYTGLSREEAFLAPEAVEMILQSVAEGTIDVTAVWGNEDKTRISVSSATKLMYDTDDVHYGIAYVVKGDGLSGEGEEWEQTNFFSYFAEDAEYAPDTELGKDFDFYLHSPEQIKDMVYNDVAVAAFGLETGLPNSVASPAVAGVASSFDYTISIANNSLVADKDRLYVVAMLLDTESGRIVNAAECKVTESVSVDGIGIDNTRVETGRFDFTGKRVTPSYKGVVIVTYSDGTLGKVMAR